MSWLQWLMSLFTAPAPAPQPPAPPPAPGLLATALLTAHNAARAKHGLGPLRANATLQVAAQGHARDMAATRAIDHNGFAHRVHGFGRAGENVAYGYLTAQAVVDGWLGDPGHAVNVLGSYTELGAAGSQAADGTWYWCADYGSFA